MISAQELLKLDEIGKTHKRELRARLKAADAASARVEELRTLLRERQAQTELVPAGVDVDPGDLAQSHVLAQVAGGMVPLLQRELAQAQTVATGARERLSQYVGILAARRRDIAKIDEEIGKLQAKRKELEAFLAQ